MASTYIGLPAIQRRARAALRDGVELSTEILAIKASARAPKDTGTLAAGIHATPARHITPDLVEAKVQTGAGADEYAVIQHQRREGVKYIEGPLLEHLPEHARIVAGAVKARL